MLLLRDTFQGTGPTAIAAHTPQVGGPWTSDSVGFTVQTNRLDQSADNPAARVSMGRKTARVQVDIELHGMDPANYLNFYLRDDSGANELQVDVLGDGSWTIALAAGGNSTIFNSLIAGQAAAVPLVGRSVLSMAVGPSICTVLLNSRMLYASPRYIETSVILSQFLMQAGALNGLPSGLIRALTITD